MKHRFEEQATSDQSCFYQDDVFALEIRKEARQVFCYLFNPFLFR